MSTEKYNGWTNYETWNAALCVDNNDAGDQAYWNEQASECYDDAEADKTFTKLENATLALSERMKEQFEEAAEQWMPDQSSMFAYFINASLSAVNWHEIAEHYTKEIDQSE